MIYFLCDSFLLLDFFFSVKDIVIDMLVDAVQEYFSPSSILFFHITFSCNWGISFSRVLGNNFATILCFRWNVDCQIISLCKTFSQ